MDLSRWAMFKDSALLTTQEEEPHHWQESRNAPCIPERSCLALRLEIQAGFQPTVYKSLVPGEGSATLHTSRLVAGDELSPKGNGVRATTVQHHFSSWLMLQVPERGGCRLCSALSPRSCLHALAQPLGCEKLGWEQSSV